MLQSPGHPIFPHTQSHPSTQPHPKYTAPIQVHCLNPSTLPQPKYTASLPSTPSTLLPNRPVTLLS